MSLDVYDIYPKYMRAYLMNYGWHFNKAMCDFATSKMIKNNKPLIAITKE